MAIVEVSRVAFTTFQLSRVAYWWWKAYEEGRPADAAPLIWDHFSDMFLRECVPQTLRDAWRIEFEQLHQGTISVSEYAIRFSELCLHAPAFVSTGRERVRRFIEGLDYGLRFSMARELEMDTLYQQVVEIAWRLEGMRGLEIEDRKAKRPRDSGGYSGARAPVAARHAHLAQPLSSAPPAWGAFSRQSSRPGQDQFQQPCPPRACVLCGDTRHMVRDYPRLRRGAPPQTTHALRIPQSP
ncbi:uncharacterized protein [Nicotiana tomentosiformis]|uniref:uncharacterized protein n=1 Tax=Nicotiana tomentosiformis TaxID=4098 RepID=UPI00388CBC1D